MLLTALSESGGYDIGVSDNYALKRDAGVSYNQALFVTENLLVMLPRRGEVTQEANLPAI